MSSVARPRGPLPARVYWVRRAIVLVTAFLLIFGLARLLGSGSDGDGDGAGPVAEQAAGQQSDDQPSATDSEATDPTASTSPTSKAKKTKTPLAEPTGPCDPADITVSPEVDQVAANDTIDIPFKITGTDEACTFTVSSKSMVIKITSGSDLIWSSQQCAQLPEEGIVVRSAKATKVVLEWNGRRSDDDCDRTAAWAKIGWYHVEAAAFGGEPTSDKFELTPPKPKKVYKTEKPKTDKKKSNKKSDKSKKKNKKKTDKKQD